MLVPAVFAASVAPTLGIEMPMVESGSYSVPRFNKSLKAAMKDKANAVESSAATFTTTTVEPTKRITARLTVSEHDLAAVGIPAFEQSLEENMRMVLGDALDTQLLRGDGTAPNLKSIASQLTAQSDPGGAITLATAASELGAFIDGKFATDLNELRALVNPAVMAKLAATFATNDDSVTVLEWLRRQGVTVASNANMSASASNVAKSIVTRAGAMVRGASGPLAVCPIWKNISVRDPYSDSASVQKHVTLATILGDVVIRYGDAYREWRVKTK